jgi:Flp pilus assembly protein TadD
VGKEQDEDQPLQPSNKVKVGLVRVHSADEDMGKKEPLRPKKTRQGEPRILEREKAEQIAALDTSKESRPIMITGGQKPGPSRGKKIGKVDLQAEPTVGSAALYRKAVSYQRAMKWPMAIETYKKVLKFEPMSAEVYNNIGVCYEKQGQLKLAAKSYEKAIGINPRFYPSYNNLGIIYYRMKDFNKARAAYEQALQLNPGNSQSEVNLALVYERLRRPELARRTLERVLVNEPENAEAHYNLARMLEDQGQHNEALSHYRQFLAANSSAYPKLREKVQTRVRTLEKASKSP